MELTDPHSLIIEAAYGRNNSIFETPDYFIRSKCSCGWFDQWTHWAFSGEIHPPHMMPLILHWQKHIRHVNDKHRT